MVGTQNLDASSSAMMERLLWAVDDLAIELPSWGFVNTGTRFRVWQQAGVPRTVDEKIDDAGTVRRYTGIARSVALHIPWDKVDDYAAPGRPHRESRPARSAASTATPSRTPTTCSARCAIPPARCAPRPWRPSSSAARSRPRMEAPAVKVWLGDGTNYPARTTCATADTASWRACRPSTRSCRSTPACSSSTRSSSRRSTRPTCRTGARRWPSAASVGERAVVCVDTGHHSLGVNIEQIVALLLAEGKLGAFDLNDKKYGDDDLMVGSIDPYQLFRIMHELVNAMRDDGDPGAQALRTRDRLHARPVPQHRAQDPGHDPLGHEPPGDVRQGAPGGPRGTRGSPGEGRRPGGQRASSGTPSAPTCAARSRSCAWRAACRPTRSTPTSTAARRRSERRPGWGHRGELVAGPVAASQAVR